MALSCKDQGKQQSTQYYARPNISAIEIRSPETVIAEVTGFEGEILNPKVYSPKAQFNSLTSGGKSISRVLNSLITAEKVARRQYDELLTFPEVSKFISDLLYIRNDEHEHEKILECIIQRLGIIPAAQPMITQPTQLPQVRYQGKTWFYDKRLSQIRNVNNPHEYINLNETELSTLEENTRTKPLTLTPKTIGEFYETILDRFGDEEEKSVNSYQEFLVKVQESKAALEDARLKGLTTHESYNAVMVPLNELERKVNKHLNEERVHLDVIDTMREMFTNMKLGNVY